MLNVAEQRVWQCIGNCAVSKIANERSIVTLEVNYSVIFGSALQITGMLFRLAGNQDSLLAAYHGGTDRTSLLNDLGLQGC